MNERFVFKAIIVNLVAFVFISGLIGKESYYKARMASHCRMRCQKVSQGRLVAVNGLYPGYPSYYDSYPFAMPDYGWPYWGYGGWTDRRWGWGKGWFNPGGGGWHGRSRR